MALDLAKWVWKVLNLLAAGLLAASGCALLYYHTNLNTIISGIVVVVFSLLLIMIEFWVPERLEEVGISPQGT